MVETVNQQKLYQQDFVACDDTVTKLKRVIFSEIDTDSLIEEIEGLAGRDRRELKRFEKYCCSSAKTTYVESPNDYRGLEVTIREQSANTYSFQNNPQACETITAA